ncbi:MAG: hypothetical protein ABSH20_32100 [Tepidisphaeraceae bacterium]
MSRPAPDESDEARWSCWPEIEVEDLRAENAVLRLKVRTLIEVMLAAEAYGSGWPEREPNLRLIFDRQFPTGAAPQVDSLAGLIEWRA